MKTTKTIPRLITNAIALFLLFIGISTSLTSCAEDECRIGCEPIDFKTAVFHDSQLIETANINYGEHSQTLTTFIKASSHPSDLAPLVLLVTGGGLTSWSQEASLKGMGSHLAKRGYAFGLVKHRLSSTPSPDAWIKAMQDVFTAIRYYKENASKYGIDPNQIILGGWSTGAIAALNVAFTSLEEVESSNQLIAEDLIESIENIDGGYYGKLYPNQSNDIAGLLIMMAYAWDINVINEVTVPVMLINHKDVAFSDGTKFIGEFEFDNSPGWGTDPINQKLLEIGYEKEVDLTYIRSEEHNGTSNFSPNISTLTSDNYPQIVAFFSQHVQ